MKLKVKKINFETGNVQDVILHIRDANKLGRKSGDRIIIKNPESKSLENKYKVAILQIVVLTYPVLSLRTCIALEQRVQEVFSSYVKEL